MKEYKAISMDKEEIVKIIESKGYKVYEIYDDFIGPIVLEDENKDAEDVLAEYFNCKHSCILYYPYGMTSKKSEFVVIPYGLKEAKE